MTKMMVNVRHAHLVLAEDDASIRGSIRRGLRHLPLTVVDFSDSRAATAYLRVPRAPVDIVWADLVLEDGPSGPHLLEVAAQRTPRPHLMLVSGGGPAPVQLPAGTKVFGKPDLGPAIAWVQALLKGDGA